MRPLGLDRPTVAQASLISPRQGGTMLPICLGCAELSEGRQATPLTASAMMTPESDFGRSKP